MNKPGDVIFSLTRQQLVLLHDPNATLTHKKDSRLILQHRKLLKRIDGEWKITPAGGHLLRAIVLMAKNRGGK